MPSRAWRDLLRSAASPDAVTYALPNIMYTVVKGDLLDAKEAYILQQNCCIACKAHGLSEVISKRYPYADPYSSRRRMGKRNMAVPTDRSVPGTIQVFRPESGEGPAFVSMYAQYGMGAPYSYNNSDKHFADSTLHRYQFFTQCLERVAHLKPVSVAMPYNIGCGLAGGRWSVYEKMIADWAKANPDIKVVLYKL